MEIYFDNAASTPMCPEATAAIFDVLENVYGNPSSGHAAGRLAERRLKESRETIAELYGVPANEIIFTSGGTESNNLAILGTVKRPGCRIITSLAEHPSVLDSYKALSERGADAVYLRPDNNGIIDPNELALAINERTALVSLSHVNHETGAISDIASFGRIIKDRKEDAIFHADAVQSFGKHKLSLKNVDLISVSAHKLHGPKGVGALYVRGLSRNWLAPLSHGGGQEHGARNGTENLPGIAGFAAAVSACSQEDYNKISGFKKRILDCLLPLGAVLNGSPDGSAYITNISFPNLPSEVLLNALDARGIYVSAGAACNTKKKAAENVVSAYGLGTERAASAVRISLSRLNSIEEIDIFNRVLSEILPSIWRKRS